MKRIKRLSKILRAMCVVGLILLPVGHVISLILSGSLASGISHHNVTLGTRLLGFLLRLPSFHLFWNDQLKVWARVLGSEQTLVKALRAAFELTGAVLAMIGLYLLIRLFGLYSRERVFDPESVSALRKIGYFSVIWVTFHQTHRFLNLPLSTENLIDAVIQTMAFGIETTVTICFAVLVFIFVWTMDDASRLWYRQQETNTKKIRQASKILRQLCIFALVLLPVVEVLYWIDVDYWRALHIDDLTGPWPRVSDQLPVKELTKVVGFVSRLFPLIVIMTALGALAKLLNLVGHGDAFSAASARCARVIGYAIMIGQILRPFYDALTTAAFSFNAPPGLKTSYIGFGASNLTYITFGLMILLLSRILSEGRELKELPEARAGIGQDYSLHRAKADIMKELPFRESEKSDQPVVSQSGVQSALGCHTHRRAPSLNPLEGKTTIEPVVHPIGRVRSSLTDLSQCPHQGSEGAPAAWLEVDSAYIEGLIGIEPGTEIIILTWMHLGTGQPCKFIRKRTPASLLRVCLRPDRPTGLIP